MPYSITTEDGITIDNIPDSTPSDSQELRQRVAQIRAVSDANATTVPTANATTGGSKLASFGMGFGFDLPAAAAQIVERVPGLNLAPAAIRWSLNKGLGAVGADDAARLFEPQSAGDVDSAIKQINQDYEQERTAAGRDGFDWSRMAGNIANPLNWAAGTKAGSAAMKLLPDASGAALKAAASGAAGGAAGAALSPVMEVPEDGSVAAEKAKQVGAGAVLGAALGPVANAVGKTAARVRGRMTASVAPTVTPEDVRVVTNNFFASNGMQMREMPQLMQDSVARQLGEAMRAGARPDPAAILRMAQAEAVGLAGDSAMTAGQSSRNSIQLAQERNLSGIVLDTPQGPTNPMAERINNQQLALQRNFDTLGAGAAIDQVTAAETLKRSLLAADAPVKSGVDDLYTAAKAMPGRKAQVDGYQFTTEVNKKLDAEMLGDLLPPEATGFLNKIASGKMPLTVENLVVMDRRLSAMQRAMGIDDNKKMAIGIVRDYLNEAPMARQMPDLPGAPAMPQNMADVVDNGITDVASTPIYPPSLPRPAGAGLSPKPTYPNAPPPQGNGMSVAGDQMPDQGMAAREAFEAARAAARRRFATIDETPALKAALDDQAPDDFVRKYVIGADVRELKSLKSVLGNDPEALGQARSQMAEHLRAAAFGPRGGSGDKTFQAARYLKTLDAIGPQKLSVFFNPQEVVQLKLVGKVADDVVSEPAGSRYATNRSGTAAAAANLFAMLAGKIPGGRYVAGAARLIGNQAGQIKSEQQLRQALSGKLPPNLEPRVPTPQELELLMRLQAAPASSAAAMAAGLFGNTSEE